MSDIDKMIETIQEADESRRRGLELILGELEKKSGHHLAIRAHMGKTSSYVTTVTFDWVAQHVGYAAGLPMFEREGEDGRSPHDTKIEINKKTIDFIQQRQPDWARQLPMVCYLAIREHHKFPPLLVVGYQDWVYDDDNSEHWEEDGSAVADSLTVTSLESSGTYHELDDRVTNFYALDGQHRLMAIQGLNELLKKGELNARNKDGKVKRNASVSREEIIDRVHDVTGEDLAVIRNRLENLMFERIGIEIIPAVAAGEDFKGALHRLRQIFVDVNQRAKSLTKGEITLLDENDGFRVVARQIMTTHPLLADRKVAHKTRTLPEASPCYTTLEALVEIVRAYLGSREEFASWGDDSLGGKDFGSMRPSEYEIENGKEIIDQYFDALMGLPSHLQCVQGRAANELRVNEDNILFRPLAQVALASAIGYLEREDGMEINEIIEIIARQEEKGQLRLKEHDAPWYGVLSDPISGHMRRHKFFQLLCTRMFRFLVKGIADNEEREELEKDFRYARLIEEGRSRNLDGKIVPSEEVQLPVPWKWQG